MKHPLLHKVAVVTGGAMGIGLATAKRLVHEGCTVVLWDLNPAALETAVNSLRANGGTAHGMVCDVTDRERVYALAREVEQTVGPIAILVNNAGFVRGGDFLEGADADWERTIAVNLTALIYTTRAVLPGMYARKEGNVINISSAAGMLGVPRLAVYCATKWAVWGLTESLRFEAREHGCPNVHFSSIHPSYLAEGMFAGARLNPLGNLVIPLVKSHDTIARAIVDRAIKRGCYSPKRPVTLNLTPRLRGLLPDMVFQRLLILLGVTGSMSGWRGRTQA